MWLFTSSGFLSIVRPAGYDPIVIDMLKERGLDPASVGSFLLVRARRKGQIEAHFSAKVRKVAGRDYLYRALVYRQDVAAAVAAMVANISYTNFKDSVKDHDLHDACGRVWGVMHSYQSAERAQPRMTNGLELREYFQREADDLGLDDAPGFRRGSRSPIIKPKRALPGNTKKGRR